MPDDADASISGVETEADAGSATGADAPAESFMLHSPHVRLTQVNLQDTTDRHNELVHERQWLLHPNQMPLELAGNLFLVEDLTEGTGNWLIKQAPLPHARPTPSPVDLRITRQTDGPGFVFALLTSSSTHESWSILPYTGDAVERFRVMQDWQQSRRPPVSAHRLPRFLSNTWGDRSRDSRMNESFISAEIEAAGRLGVDVVQLDDGWQKGTSSNSARAAELGGVWEGFWNVDERFWDPHPERFPHGLGPIVERARTAGVQLGLWFAPDSWSDYVHWRRDADRLLELHREFGIEHFKIDGVKAETELALANLHAFFQAVLEGSKGRIVLDLDITAGVRPGYFGAMPVGPLFVENRYTDWHNYWPHQTLRNLWQLSRWIDPRRLRMEFLNHTRNIDRYAGDPLAPSNYPPDTLFAMVMFANPLGWFEVSNLPDAYVEAVAPLVQIWKQHREAIFSGTIMPIGQAPDGWSYAGFVSWSDTRDQGYILVFRELHPEDSARIEMPAMSPGQYAFEVLAGQGDVAFDDDALRVTIPNQLGYLFARFERTSQR